MQDKEPRNINNKPNGYWETYYSNDKLCLKGYFINGKQYGFFEYYYYTGKLDTKEYYAR